MTALHLVVRPRGEHFPSTSRLSDEPPLGLLAGTRVALPPMSPAERIELSLALAEASCELLEGVTGCATVPFDAEGEIWEFGLELCLGDILVSLYRPSPAPRVTSHERRIARGEFVRAQLAQLTEMSRTDATDAPSGRLVVRRASVCQRLDKRLRATTPEVGAPKAARSRREAVGPKVEGLCLRATGDFKVIRPGIVDCERVERSDLHSLLVQGSLVINAGKARICSDRSQLFLDTERLLLGADQVLTTWETGRVLATRIQLSELQLSLYRTRADGPVELSVRGPEGDLTRRRLHLVNVSTLAWVRAVCHFAKALVAAYCEADDRQHRNLRLVSLQTHSAGLLERASVEEGALTNSRPERYRRFARHRRSMAAGMWERGGKMRFSARWVATVPGLDLRATFLCGKSIIVDSSRETACIDRLNGKILWRAPSGPAACTVSPAGLIRFRPDGHLSSVDVATGETRFALQLKPRTGGGAAGSLVHSDGLPKILVLTEGDRQVSAVDLVTGDVRWRHTTSRPGTFRLRRVGRLLLAAGGSSTLFALDVTTGEAVWRHCSRLPFSGALAVDARSAVGISGAPGCWQVQHVDPWTGECRWTADLAESPLPGRHPLLASEVVVVPVGNESACGAEAFDRRTGRCLWRHHADLASPTSAWMAVDDLVIINDAAGVLMCLEANSGRPLFNHVFAGNCEADTPRRLEPVLRHGALFVPQQQVHVVRPRSGEIIGSIPPDLVPDLLRVDERCDVYVGEESGHLAAFGAAPQLAVV